MLSVYVKKAQSGSHVKGDLFDVEVSNQVTALYNLATGYSAKKGGEPPVPQDIVVRKTPKKTALRCVFPAELDLPTLNNAILDLGLEHNVSFPDAVGEKTVIDIH
jgi:hypothetical protein